jgi:general secretion pathway protein A
VFASEAPAPRAPMRWPMVAGGVLAGVALSALAWQAVPHRRAAAPAQLATAAKGKPAALAAADSHGAAPAQPLALATQQDALHELGALWGQQLPAAEPCAAAPRLGLRCYQGRGGIYELRLLDRPAIVALHDGQKVGYALLTKLGADSATLSAAGRSEQVSLGALATRFDGEFTTLWQAPRGFRDQVGPGDRGPDVDWIAARLAQLNKTAAPPAARPLDEPTARNLRAFQAAQNLKADGVAGPRTYMRLNQVSGVEEPRLLAGASGTTTGK